MKKRFQVAFSFAGQKRDFVSKVAALLEEGLGRSAILYDQFLEAEFARADLALLLPYLYRKQSELIVVVICKNYRRRNWCGLEWRAIYSLIMKRKNRGVMLCRFDGSMIEGLDENAGFVELDQKSPEELAALIGERLGSEKSALKKPPSGTKIPNNLPRLQHFFGREAELSKIATAISRESRGWGVLIDGPGGIGKTSLAIQAATSVPDGRFRRIIFLSAKKSELTSTGERALNEFVVSGYLEMLNAIARELGQPELAQSRVEERSELIKRALHDKDVLLVLDNLETLSEPERASMHEFLRNLPPGCNALATSRRRDDAGGAVNVRLGELDWPAAEALLAKLADEYKILESASPKERRELYDETGGNPLLIRWLAGQLGHGRCKTIKSSLDLLRKPSDDKNAPLKFVFGDLLDTFTESEEKVLVALCQFSDAAHVQFIAQLSDLAELKAHKALGDLARRALVMPDAEQTRFALVPLVADFLRSLRPRKIEKTSERLEKLVLDIIKKHGGRGNAPFVIMEDAWPLIESALPLFVAGSSKRLQTVCDEIHHFLDFSGRWDERLSLCQKGEEKAVLDKDFGKAGKRACQVSMVCFKRKQPKEMKSWVDKADANWAKTSPNGRQKADILRHRGLYCFLAEDYAEAIEFQKRALKLYRNLSDPRDVAKSLNALGEAERELRCFSQAEEHFKEALTIASEIGAISGRANYMGNLAELALDQHDWPTAEMYAREALPLAKDVGRIEIIAQLSRCLAMALAKQKRAVEGRQYAEAAVEYYKKLDSPLLPVAVEVLNDCNRRSFSL